MDDELEVIRDQMEETRASLADKLEALETQVRETVQSASETVTSAVDGAKEVVTSVSEGAKQVVEKVTETVENVKETLSLSHTVERHPWAAVGASVAAGFVLAQLLPSRARVARALGARHAPVSTGYPSSSAFSSEPAPHSGGGGLLSGALGDVLKTAGTTLEGLAVGTLMSVVKDVISHNLPQEWQGELTRIVDDATGKLGGKVMHGNPLAELFSSGQHDHGAEQGGSPTNQGAVM